MADKEENYNDFLESFLNENNTTKSPEPLKPSKTIELGENINGINIKPKIEKPKQIENKSKINPVIESRYESNKSRYEEIFISQLPISKFYPLNSTILVRPCDVEEIENFSTYDTNNPMDFKDKLNDILEACVIFKHPDGTLGSHLNIFDGDRIWLIYYIREKTFPKGKTLTTTVTYQDVNEEPRSTKIELIRANMELWEDQPIMEYFNDETYTLDFQTTISDTKFKITPPTIGLRNCFDQYLTYKIKENKFKKEKEMPFFKIAPYLKPNVSYMSYEELEEYERWFKKDILPDEYVFLHDLINNHLKIGIKGLKKNMGVSVLRTYKMYPDNPRSLFLLPNAFELFIKK